MNKNFKFFLAISFHFLLLITLHAQKDVTKFLDIPVDGY